MAPDNIAPLKSARPKSIEASSLHSSVPSILQYLISPPRVGDSVVNWAEVALVLRVFYWWRNRKTQLEFCVMNVMAEISIGNTQKYLTQTWESGKASQQFHLR